MVKLRDVAPLTELALNGLVTETYIKEGIIRVKLHSNDDMWILRNLAEVFSYLNFMVIPIRDEVSGQYSGIEIAA